MSRIARAEAHTLSTVDDGASETESDGCDSVRIRHRLDRIEVVRTHDAREVGVEALSVQLADNLLQNHSHLFFFQAIRRGANVGLCVLAESRGIDALDRLREFVEARLQAWLLVAEHERLVDTRERLVLRVFQEARRADG